MSAFATNASVPSPTCNENTPILELQGISKRFGSNQVLNNVDLTVMPGEAIALIGPSGTGKSTILRIIAGLLAPDSGDIVVAGQQRLGLIEDAPDPVNISMVFQQAALFDSLTVQENIGFSLYQHSKLSDTEIRDLTRAALTMVGLPDICDRYPAELSGGMRKRVSFARAVMTNPQETTPKPTVLLYDEPTAGLDPVASTVIEDLIRSIHGNQACSTYLIVTHQDSTIRRTADRVILLHQGAIQWMGAVGEIDSTSNPYVRQFFNAAIDGPIQVTH